MTGPQHQPLSLHNTFALGSLWTDKQYVHVKIVDLTDAEDINGIKTTGSYGQLIYSPSDECGGIIDPISTHTTLQIGILHELEHWFTRYTSITELKK